MKLKMLVFLLFIGFSSKVMCQESCDTCLYAIAYLQPGDGGGRALYGIKWDNNTTTDLDEYYKMKRPWNEFHVDSRISELNLFNFMNRVGYDLVSVAQIPVHEYYGFMAYEWFFRKRRKI